MSPFGLDLFETIKGAAIYTGAFLSRHIPLVGASQINRPEGPEPALARPNRVNRTPFTVLVLLQKYAVPRLRILDNRQPKSSAPEEPAPELLCCHLKIFREQANLITRNPDIPPRRPRTAPAATEALKMQAGRIPEIFVFIIHSRHFTAENAEKKRKMKK